MNKRESIQRAGLLGVLAIMFGTDITGDAASDPAPVVNRGLYPVAHSGTVCKKPKAKGASKTRNKRRYR